MYLIVLSRLQLGMSSFVLRYMHIPCCRREECYVLDNIRNKDCGTQRALPTLPVGGLQQEHVLLSARHLLSKYTTHRNYVQRKIFHVDDDDDRSE